MPDNKEVADILSHKPFSPIGHSRIPSKTGKTNAVEMEIIEANTGCSMADIKLWVAKENQRVTYVILKSKRAVTAIFIIVPPNRNSMIFIKIDVIRVAILFKKLGLPQSIICFIIFYENVVCKSKVATCS